MASGPRRGAPAGASFQRLEPDGTTRCGANYSEVMGLSEIDRPAFPVDGLWFRLGAQELHIGEQDGHAAPDRQHFAVQVDDLDAAVSAIESHGVTVRKTGLTFEGAGYQAFVRDPSGNLIELNQPE